MFCPSFLPYLLFHSFRTTSYTLLQMHNPGLREVMYWQTDSQIYRCTAFCTILFVVHGAKAIVLEIVLLNYGPIFLINQQLLLILWHGSRYTLEPSFPHENCHMSERFYYDLDPYHDILPDRDYDIYSRNEYARSCQENLPQWRPHEDSGTYITIIFFPSCDVFIHITVSYSIFGSSSRPLPFFFLPSFRCLMQWHS